MGSNFHIDIELTNRCNAKCHFCPRDQTPHQGIMGPEVFSQSLTRVVEFRDVFPDDDMIVNLCGLGEPLINRDAARFVGQVREAGFSCRMSTNASLLDERRGRALLEAGLQKVHINVGDHDEGYEDVYKLPFQRTHDNVVRFAEMAGDQCEVEIVLVNYKRDLDHVHKMQDYWRDRGITNFLAFDIMNRGGALFVDHMQFEQSPHLAEARALLADVDVVPVCAAPFVFLFIGYDGLYYLCCSDWKKDVPLGSVFDTSFVSIVQQKLEHVRSREPICKTCNHDPTNRMVEALQAIEDGQVDASVKEELRNELVKNTRAVEEIAAEMERVAAPSARRTRIPISVE